VPAPPPDGGEIVVQGRGFEAWHSPTVELDCGNSGTTARLLLGLLAGRPFAATVTGDASLCSRPMRRITEPLAAMGARFDELGGPDRLPVRIEGGALHAIRHRSPKASAQINSALLLAGLSGGVPVTVVEPIQSRDHTERMLRALGVEVQSASSADGGWEVALTPPAGPLPPLDLTVPGDVSSAAFLIALALLADTGELRIRGVGINPTRTGFLDAVARMGARIEQEDPRDEGGEPVADLAIRPAALHGVEIGAAEVPALIDEVPVLAVLAARARGELRITGASELRAKECDRITAIVENLRALGADADELPDGLVVRGSDRPLAGRVRSHGDHRIAMAFGVLAALPDSDIEIDDHGVAEISFPGYWELLADLTAGGTEAAGAPAAQRAAPMKRHGLIVALDGPAGSGKSSTARAVATALGYRHLDSGAFYRGLTFAALQRGIAPERWPQLSRADLDALGVSGASRGTSFAILLGGVALGPELRAAEVNAHVSQMAAVPAVRDWLMASLRRAGEGGGLVADGRDIGTVVFPDAELKVFLVAAPEERARRRLREQGNAAPTDAEIDAEAERLLARDEIDSTREAAPLLRAPDAVQLDTTGLTFDAQVDFIVRLARARLGNSQG
jgi:3-phosphoshikimate 1-carboxyvinyltransferase